MTLYYRILPLLCTDELVYEITLFWHKFSSMNIVNFNARYLHMCTARVAWSMRDRSRESGLGSKRGRGWFSQCLTYPHAMSSTWVEVFPVTPQKPRKRSTYLF
ncbi:unnamed protein product [Chrysodeixis includens]|uniref:Uncharacterized protein n=1 Tax=Chrysodeixis includens TaxID=689277 RepID=A0A9P0BQQ2_CHRIL|nr:unnamed protein product [Chrysodeixis includens]